MSISSGSSGVSRVGASSLSSDASALAHSTGSSGAGSMCLEKSSSRAWECRGLRHGIAEFDVTTCAQLTPTCAPRLVFVADVRECASCAFGRRRRSGPLAPFGWTCDRSWDKRNTTPQRVACLDRCPLGHGVKPIGSGTRTTDSQVASQLTLHSASRKPFLRNLKRNM